MASFSGLITTLSLPGRRWKVNVKGKHTDRACLLRGISQKTSSSPRQGTLDYRIWTLWSPQLWESSEVIITFGYKIICSKSQFHGETEDAEPQSSSLPQLPHRRSGKSRSQIFYFLYIADTASLYFNQATRFINSYQIRHPLLLFPLHCCSVLTHSPPKSQVYIFIPRICARYLNRKDFCWCN